MLGTNSFGLPIHFDRNAFEADGIILLNRIKPHTSFTGPYESGLLKMLAIGLGKRQGPPRSTSWACRGCSKLIPEVGAFLLEKAPVVLGLAILENAAKRPPGSSRSSPRRCSRSSPGCWTRHARSWPACPSTRSTC